MVPSVIRPGIWSLSKVLLDFRGSVLHRETATLGRLPDNRPRKDNEKLSIRRQGGSGREKRGRERDRQHVGNAASRSTEELRARRFASKKPRVNTYFRCDFVLLFEGFATHIDDLQNSRVLPKHLTAVKNMELYLQNTACHPTLSYTNYGESNERSTLRHLHL